MYRICAITTIQGTMEWFVLDSMKHLSDNGYNVALMCNMSDDFKDNCSVFAKCYSIDIKRGISLTNLFSTIIHMIKIFKNEKFEILYYTSPNASLAAAIAGRLCGIKVRIYNQWGIRYVTFKGVKRFIFKLVEKITCALSTSVSSASPLNMQLAINEGLCPSSKISVRGVGGTVGVNLSECDSFNKQEVRNQLRKKYNIPLDAFVYGYVGRINADKGINELVEAFIEIKSEINNCWLILIGMIDDTNPISDNNLSIIHNDECIVATGNIPSSSVYQYMSMLDVLTHPTYREGFGKVLQEAMGMRLPIITTDVIGPKEVIVNNVSGILVRDHDYKDLKEKMLLLYRDKNLAESFALEGRKRAEQFFDRPIMLNNILNDINNVAKAKLVK